MKKLSILLLLLVCFGEEIIVAQPNQPQPWVLVPSVANLNRNCLVGDPAYVITATPGSNIYVCTTSATNVSPGVWTPITIGGSSSGTVGPCATINGIAVFSGSTTVGCFADGVFVEIPLSAPAAPTIVQNGMTGAETYRYSTVVFGTVGFVMSAASNTIMNGNATLSIADYIGIPLPNVSGRMCGIIRANIGQGDFDTGNYGPGFLLDMTNTLIKVACDGSTFHDIGYGGDYNVFPTPPYNQTTGISAREFVPFAVWTGQQFTPLNIGYGGQVGGNRSVNFGTGGQATGGESVNVGYGGYATGDVSINIGQNGRALCSQCVNVGENGTLKGANSSSLGDLNSDGGFIDVTMIGNAITATAAHQASVGGPNTTDLWPGGPSAIAPVTIHNLSGGLINAAVCWKTATTLGHCISVVGVGGTCTCN